MGLAIGGLQKVVNAIADIIASLVGQNIVANSITLTTHATPAYLHTTGAVVAGANEAWLGSRSAGDAALWLATAAPVATNYHFAGDSGNAYFNAPTNVIQFLIGNTAKMNLDATGFYVQTDGGLSLGTTSKHWNGLYLTTSDSSGTPGAATINASSGRSAIAAGAASVVITNNLVTAASHVFISPAARDATGLLPLVTTVGAGSFTVTTTANCTATLIFDWLVVS